MGIFNSIKKSRKKSDDIDEKIEYLNKELDKNGLREGMVTSKVYVGAKEIPNALHTDFEGQGFGGKSLAYSGSDNVEIGGAKIGNVIASEVGLSPGVPSHDAILNLSGVAQSPINPNTGRRTIAYTRTGMVQMSPARPGVDQGTQGNTTGSIVWYWDANANNPNGTVGDYRQLQFFPGSLPGDGYWAVWGSSFLGFTIPRPDLVPAEISGIFSNIGLTNRGNIGTPQTTVLTQNSLGDVAFLPLNTNLSRQGYDYLKGKAKRGTGFINYKRNQKQKLNEPPTKSPKEVRSDRVKQLKSEGDNIGANQFYTKDRIKELEGKDSLTYREESELIGLKEYSEWINTFDSSKNYVPIADQQFNFDAAAEEQSNNIFNKMNSSSSTISTTLDEILDSPDSSGLTETERKAISSFSKAIESGEEITPELFSNFESTPEAPTPPTPPKPTPAYHNPPEEFTFPDGSKGTIETSKVDGGIGDIIKNDKGEVVERNGLSNQQNKNITQSEKLRNSIDLATSILTNGIVEHKPSDQAIEQFKSNLKPEDILKFQFNTERVGYSDGNLNVTYDQNGKKIFNPNRDSSGNQGANSQDLSIEFDNLTLNNLAIAAHGKPNGQVVLPTDGSEGYAVLEKYAYHNTSTTNPFSKNFDATELPNWQTGILSGLVHLAANTPAGKTLQAVSDLFSKITGSDSKLPDFLNDYGIHGMAHHEIKVPLSELPADVLAEIKKNGNWDAYEAAQNDKNAAEKFPPPGQEAEYTNEDGGKVKYYNKGMKTSADGSKYMEILIIPWIQPSDGSPGGWGSLWSPGSYTSKIPLGGAKTRLKGAGKEVYTPKPDPKPDPKPKPQGGFGGGQGNPTNRRGSGARREDTQYQSKGKLLSEAAKLGHFDPEVLNVDINDIRKGIMPEFPKDPPPKMVDGYSEKSKLAPKKEEGFSDPFLNVTKKDLAKNHMLKDSEIKKFMDEIDLINKYIKENPSELIYAQQRYPKDDLRLAQLNWQMDQMLDAGKEYMDKTYPENKKLFKKIQKSIKKNIEFTDPKTFKDVKVPKYKGVDLTDFKRRKEVVARYFKTSVETKKLFYNQKIDNINEKLEYLNKECKKNNLQEIMTTSGMYFGTQSVDGTPAVTGIVPDSTGVLGSGFTPPIGGNGNANDPSNYPAAYDTSWMYNSDDVDGVTNRPIIKTMDQSVIDAYNTAFPDDSRFPAGGAGVVFGPRGFGTGVGYASGGHYIGVLSPGLFGNGSTKMVPPGSPFGAPWFGMGGLYFPATPELAGVIMGMTGTYQSLGGYNPQGARPVQLWAPHSTFHDGQWDDQGTQKYISNTGNRYVLRTFYMYTEPNDYVVTPAVPPTTIVLYKNNLGDPNFLPINIDLGDISTQGFEYLKDKAVASSGVNYDVYDKLWKEHGIEAANWYEENPHLPGSSNPHVNPLIPLPLELVKNDSKSEPVSDIETSGLGAESGDQLALATDTNDDAARAAYIKSGGLFPWSYLDPIQKDYWRNKVGKGSDSLGSQPEVPNEPPVYVDATEITSADIPDEFKLDDDDEKPSAKGVKLTQWMSRTDFMKLYPDSNMTEYLDALPYGATDFMTPNPKYNGAWDLNKKGFEDYFLKGDLSALGNSRGTPKPRHSEATPDPKEKKWGGKTHEQIMADLDADIAKYTAAEKAAHREMRAIALELGADFVSLIGGLFTGGTTAAPVLGKIGIKVAKKYGKSVAGKMTRKLLKRFKNQKNNKQLDDLVDFIDDSAGFDLPTPKPKPKSEPKFTDPITGKPLEKVDPSTITRPDGKPFDPLPPPPKPTPKPTPKPNSNIPPKPKDKLPDGMEWVWSNTGTGNQKGWNARFKESKPKPKPKDDFYVNLDFGYTPEGDTLSEEAMLGFFEPEQLNVNIEDLRKGIMPEFPKEAPPELINGYSSKSRLAPKKLERSSFIKITKKDLAKNHKLKDSEIKYFMNQINAVNDFIKKHPEELIYVQTRYPKSDPRLAQLNWEMDQKLNASKQYMDKHFPENQKLFTKIQKSIKKNIELTDPKSFKGVKIPKFKGIELTKFKRRKELVSRHFKKAIRKKKKET